MKSLGIDLGGTQIKFGVVESGEVVEQRICDTTISEGYESVICKIASNVQELLVLYPDVEQIGLGSPGIVDAKTGIIRYSNNFFWNDAPVCSDLEKRVCRPISIANDAQCAALGEALYGAGKGVGRMAMFTLGTGVGGAFVRNGKLELDAYGSMAYIFGHVTMEMHGRPCNCGRVGCMEQYASAAAIAREGHRQKRELASAKSVFEEARRGDEIARGVVSEFLDYFSEGVVNVANILRPHIIVIGGGVSASCDMILPRLNKALEQGVYGYHYAPVNAVAARLGNHAGVVGAASL